MVKGMVNTILQINCACIRKRAMLFKGKEIVQNSSRKNIDQLKCLLLHNTWRREKCQHDRINANTRSGQILEIGSRDIQHYC